LAVIVGIASVRLERRSEHVIRFLLSPASNVHDGQVRTRPDASVRSPVLARPRLVSRRVRPSIVRTSVPVVSERKAGPARVVGAAGAC